MIGMSGWKQGMKRVPQNKRLKKAFLTVLTGMALPAGSVRADAVYTWGYNGSGELGDGTTMDRSTPVALTDTLSSGVTSIAGGLNHSLAVRNGGVYAWGWNFYGQLGDGTTTERHTPVPMTGILSSGVTAIAGGAYHSLAVRSGGVYAWGSNAYGELGDGTTTQRNFPVALTGSLSSGVTAIAAGYTHSLAVRNGGVYAFGN